MALPVSISGVIFPPIEAGRLGPFISSGGNVYFVAVDSTNTDDITVRKATDPTSSFSSAGTDQTPSSGNAIDSISVLQNGDDLHVALRTANNEIFYLRFSMSSDSWTQTAVSVASSLSGLGTHEAQVDLARRSDGDLIICGNGSNHKDMGTSYASVSEWHSTDNGSNWSTEQEVDDDSANNFEQCHVAIGDSDAAHFVFKDGSDSVLQRAMSSADSLQTIRDTGVGLDGGTNSCIAFGVSFSRSSTTKLRFLYFGDTNGVDVLTFDAAADPSSFSSIAADGANVPTVGTEVPFSLAVDTSTETLWAAWVRNSDADVYYGNDGGSDSFGSATSHLTGSAGGISANIYTRSGAVKLAYVVNDGGTLKYNEYEISAADSTPLEAVSSKQFGQTDFLFSRPNVIGYDQ